MTGGQLLLALSSSVRFSCAGERERERDNECKHRESERERARERERKSFRLTENH